MSWELEERHASNLRIGPWMSEAFNLFGVQWGVWLAHGAVAAVGPSVLGGAVFAVLLGAGIFTSLDSGEVPWMFIGSAVGAGFGLVLFILAWCSAAMLRSAARQLCGGTPALEDLRVPPRIALRMMGCLLIMLVLGGLGVLLCLVPFFMVAGAFFYAPALIAVGGMSTTRALGASYEATRRHFWMNCLWAALVGLVGQSGGVLLCGHLATLPLSFIMMMVGYRDTFGLEGAVGPPAAVEDR